MIYLVTGNLQLFESPEYKIISVEESLKIMSNWSMYQYDSETNGKDCHINDLLCIQFGNIEGTVQIVVDITTTNILHYKEYIESHYMIGQNLKFDLQFLFNYGIVPRKIYDTMIVEQVLYLGYPYSLISQELYKENNFDFPYKLVYDKDDKLLGLELSFSLWALAYKYLKVNIDKTIRGEIIWRGLDTSVIKYAAGDVTYLGHIMKCQLQECKKKDCIIAAKLECDFVPVISYMEWCGIKLDENKWKIKMENDLKNLEEAKKALNEFVIRTPSLQQFTYIDPQGYLFEGFDLTPKVNINWSSSTQVVKVAKILGFNTTIQDKKSGKDKDSVLEKHLKKQKGINDEFLKLYFGKGEEGDEDYFAGYSGSVKVVTSFGQGHLNSINPKTGRIHTQYKQLGADTGRMSCGSTEPNIDLAKLKKLPQDSCKYPNMQQLPHDAITRSCFIAEKGNLWVSCDYSAIESRLGGAIYKEKSIIDEFLHGSGDMHSLVAKMVFKELKDVPVKEIKKRFPHLRNAAKPIEFSQQFGGSAFAIQNAMGCTLAEAQAFADAYANGFKGIAKFKAKGSYYVRKYGHIVLCPITGHKTYWWDHDMWLTRQKSYTQEFWNDYKKNHKGTGDSVVLEVKRHSQAASKWDRKALNSVTQGTGAIILKDSQIDVFNWVVDNGYFGKIKLCNLTHDEANWEFPEELKDTFPKFLKSTMEKSAYKYCKELPIPAEASVGDHWIH